MQTFFLIATAALAATTAYAQAGSADGPNNSTVPTAQDGNHTIHYVDVAKGGHYYIPNSIQAEIGDTVTFRFYPTNHSVIRAEYKFPCIPYEDVVPGGRGFDSGFHASMEISDEPDTWNLTVDSTDPIFYYCGAPGSCDDWGMVGVINANATQDVTEQIALAKEADYVLLPGEPFPDEAMASASSMANSATTATVTASSTPSGSAAAGTGGTTESHHSSGLSGGVIAGIVIGAVAVIAIIAGLFFLLKRTKNIKRKLDEREKQDRTASTFGPPSWQPANGQYFNPQTPHQSAQLPPYGHPDHGFYEQKPTDETMSLTSGPMSPPLRAQSPPMPQMGQQHPMPGFAGMQQDQRGSQYGNGYGYTSVSELSGSGPMAAEMYTPSKDGTSPEGHPAYNK